MEVGVIGLGQIGGGVAQCLARADLLHAVYDIRPEAAAAIGGLPAPSATPAAVALDSDVVLIAVVDAAQTRAVLEGPDGILATARRGLIVVLLATVSLEDLGRLRATCAAAGVPLIDSGVAGGPRAADKGIVCLVGAEDEDLARALPALEGFARRVIHMGPPDAGMAAKIARNAIAMGCLRAGYEGAILAKAYGIDVKLLAEVIDETADSGIGPLMFLRRAADPASDAGEARFREAMRKVMVKDIEAGIALGRARQITLPLLDLAHGSSRQLSGLEP